MVGWLQGLEGLSMLLFALPFGMWADRWRRDRVLKVASCLELGVLSRFECRSHGDQRSQSQPAFD